jgi:hydroxyethylthiazole kinase-like uncharacterized protein yjeF
VKRIVTPSEMQHADARAIASGVSESELVHRAGQAVAWAARSMLNGLYGRRIVAVCGGGNNGADGRVAAMQLHAWGVRAEIVDLKGIDHAAFERLLKRSNLVIDAMFGTGFRGPLSDDARRAIAAIERSNQPVLAVDIPSGIDAHTGAVHDLAVRAVRTITFQAPKVGLCSEPGRTYAGRVDVADIGIDIGPPLTWTTSGPWLGAPTPSDIAEALPARALDAHKWDAAVYVVGGSLGMSGAPAMSAHAALRAGAGMVWLASPASISGCAPELIVRQLPGTTDGAALQPEATSTVLDALDRFGALVLGPGLGRAESSANVVRQLVVAAPVPLVLDADGLRAVASHRDVLVRRSANNVGPTVLTPHEGEYQMLTGHAVGTDRVDAARRLARDTDAVVVLKGPATIVAAPDGRTISNPTGSEVLASAGTGDVLSGVIGALLAMGSEPFIAAAVAVYIHGAAAQPLDVGSTASDVIAALASTLQQHQHMRRTHHV